MTPKRWHAWYTEGREFSSSDTEWHALPDDGALSFAAEFHNGCHEIAFGRECYGLSADAADRIFVMPDESDNEYGVLRDELTRLMTERYGDVGLKFGDWTTDEDMSRVMLETMAWR